MAAELHDTEPLKVVQEIATKDVQFLPQVVWSPLVVEECVD